MKARRPTKAQARVLRVMADGAVIEVWYDIGRLAQCRLEAAGSQVVIPTPNTVHGNTVEAMRRARWIADPGARGWRGTTYRITDEGRDALALITTDQEVHP